MKILPRRFENKIFPITESGCWIWMGRLHAAGYGEFDRPKTMEPGSKLAHRISYEILKGPIPEGLEIDHLCRVRCCVNPDHLEPVTKLINIRRGDAGKHQKIKTQCPHGHIYTPENTLIQQIKFRECRECKRLRSLRIYHRDKEKINKRKRDKRKEKMT